MTLSRTLLAMALLVVAVNVAEARGAEPWTAPSAISGTKDYFPQLTFAPNGVGFAGWAFGGASPRYGDVGGAPVTAEGAAGAARTLTTGFLPARFATWAPNRLIAVGTRFTATSPRPVYATGRTSGALGGPKPIAGSRRGYAVDVATTQAGLVAAAVRLCESASRCRRPAPHLVLRRPGGRFGKPIRLGDGPVSAMAVDVNARGDVLAVWDRPLRGSTGRRGIHAAIRTAGGRLTVRRLGTSHPIPRLSAAIGTGRAAVVGWLGQRISEGDPLSDAEVHVAEAATGGRFGAADRVETVPNLGTGHYIGHGGIEVAVAADGRKLAAWTGYANGRFVVRAANLENGSLPQPIQTISDPATDTVFADLATGAGGEALVAGLTGIRGADPGGPVGVVAMTRAAGEKAFGTLEQVASPAGFREGVSAAIAPTSNRPVVVWRNLDPGSVQISSRPSIG